MRLSFYAYLKWSSVVQSYFLLNLLHLLSLLKKLRTFGFPLLVLLQRIVFLLHQGSDFTVDYLKIFNNILIGLFLSQPYILSNLCKLFLDLKDDPIFLLTYLLDYSFLELVIVYLRVQLVFPVFVALKLFVGGFHELVDFCQCFEGVLLVSSEEGAMGTEFCAVIDADNLYFFLVVGT